MDYWTRNMAIFHQGDISAMSLHWNNVHFAELLWLLFKWTGKWIIVHKIDVTGTHSSFFIYFVILSHVIWSMWQWHDKFEVQISSFLLLASLFDESYFLQIDEPAYEQNILFTEHVWCKSYTKLMQIYSSTHNALHFHLNKKLLSM